MCFGKGHPQLLRTVRLAKDGVRYQMVSSGEIMSTAVDGHFYYRVKPGTVRAKTSTLFPPCVMKSTRTLDSSARQKNERQEKRQVQSGRASRPRGVFPALRVVHLLDVAHRVFARAN